MECEPPRAAVVFTMHVALLLSVLGASPSTLHTDRVLKVLPAPKDDAARRRALLRAATLLDRRGLELELGGARIAGRDLRLVAGKKKEPLLRAMREHTKRAIDLDDFLYFVDDVLGRGYRKRVVVLTADRARKAGVLVHPRDVFRDDPRTYGDPRVRISLEAPPEQVDLEPAADGDLLGPRWAARFKQPETEDARLDALDEANASFGRRVRSLREQLVRQGALVYVEATVRPRPRGYLMYGAHLIRKSKTRRDVNRRVRRIEKLNTAWDLDVPIRWRHPDGWLATREAARQMADTYGVDYATEAGAKRSDHYDGGAIDLWAVGLPRTLELVAPDGAKARFDLSAPEETRDLNLSPDLVDWIEEHFRFRKIRTDYPHWGDADLKS